MTEALTKEMECRRQALDLEPFGAVSKLRKIQDFGERLQRKCEEIFSAYKEVAFVPLNLEIQSARIGPEAATFSVISSQYREISGRIQKETEKFLNSGNLGNSIRARVQDCQFDVCNLILTKELIDFFKTDRTETPVDKNLETDLLERFGRDGTGKILNSLTAVETVFGQFEVIFREIGKLTTTLDLVGITGKIEAAKIKPSSADLFGVLDELMSYKTALKRSLKEIDDIGKHLIDQAAEMKRELGVYLK